MTTNHRAGATTRDFDATVVMDRISDDPTAAEDGLAAELAATAPRRLWNRGTIVLTALLLAGGGFLGGAYTQQQYGQPANGAQPARSGTGGTRGQFGGFAPDAAQQNQGGAAPAASGAASAGGGSATTTGTVKLIDGETVYVQTSDGRTVTVRTTDSTVVRTAKKAALTDLGPGDAVTVQGSTGDNDTVTATSVTGEPN